MGTRGRGDQTWDLREEAQEREAGGTEGGNGGIWDPGSAAFGAWVGADSRGWGGQDFTGNSPAPSPSPPTLLVVW